MPFLDKTVRELVQVTYSVVVLPYHHGVWEVTKILPYIQDLCRTNDTYCDLYLDYQWFCLINRNWLLGDKARSSDNIIQTWTATVAARFFLDRDYLRTLFKSTTDNHNSEMRARTMFKYAAHRGVSGSPTYFMNEVMVDNIPETS